MSQSTEEVKVLCKQYLLEADGDVFLAYSLMKLECGIINTPVPVKDFEEFKGYIQDQ